MEHELISTRSFAKATHLERFTFGAEALMRLTGVKKLNELYGKAFHNKEHFIVSIFDQLSISINLESKELSKIPESGPFITVSNHPFGALDGLVLLYILTKVRTDYKVMVNFLLKEVQPLAHSFISINPFENRKDLGSSIGGTREAINWLKAGHGLGIFPAGEVSSFQKKSLIVTDKTWSNSIIKLIIKANVPIIPIHFQGSNSLLFQCLGVIHPTLRTVALPSELLKKRDSTIKVRIGNPVNKEEQKGWKNAKEFGRFLRAKTYSLDSEIESISFFKEKIKPLTAPKEIAQANSSATLAKEISNLDAFKLIEKSEFVLYLTPAKNIPVILNEIGRLREITFREVGEGTNKSRDIDEYDLYYNHLFLWDKNNHKIVGAYRLGLGNEILKNYGKHGFYLNSLFKFKREFEPILGKSIEMGRSFIVKDYQQKRLPLFLLWQGIVGFIGKNDSYKYLVGPVSISNSYSKLSRNLMVEFIRKFYFNSEFSNLIEPRKRYKVNFKRNDGSILLKNIDNNVKKFDRIISDIEPTHAPVPILIKKYLKQNAKIIGFNLDPKFNNALDGFMILDIADLPKDSILSLKNEML